MLAVFLDEVASLVRQLYYGVIFTFDHRAELYILVVGNVYFFTMVFDVYLAFLICDITVRTYYECLNQLSSICEMKTKCKALEETVSSAEIRRIPHFLSFEISGEKMFTAQ